MRWLVVLALVVVPCVYPLYFHIKEGETRCFIEELPEETMVVGLFCRSLIFGYMTFGSLGVPIACAP